MCYLSKENTRTKLFILVIAPVYLLTTREFLLRNIVLYTLQQRTMATYQALKDLELTRDELDRFKEAFKDQEFRKLFGEYVAEIQDPENQKLYQKEITELEKERGVDVTFLNPIPGWVIKTSVDGHKKCFVNVCGNENINKPSWSVGSENGARGMQWSIPHSISPVREDMDRKNVRCDVYDVLFHPDTLRLAGSNKGFRDVVNKTACEAVESSFGVQLDVNNLKFPNLKYKGVKTACVIRKTSKEGPVEMSPEEQSVYDKIFEGAGDYMSNRPKSPKKTKLRKKNESAYTKPNYIIKHRSKVDMQDFTEDRDSKINSTIPKELIIEVNLPLLKSADDIDLDVMEKSVHLMSETPAKYKLEIALPYRVDQDIGNAKFDKDKKQLIITLPVKREALSLSNIHSDSGVESDHNSPVSENQSFIQPKLETLLTSFLDETLHYNLPDFTCHMFESNVAFTLNVKNVDEQTVEKKFVDDNSLHLKFSTISSGFFPQHYAFYLRLVEHRIDSDEFCVEVWDNNVVVQVGFLPKEIKLEKYYVGINEENLTLKYIQEASILNKVLESSEFNSDDEAIEAEEMKIEEQPSSVEQKMETKQTEKSKAIDICQTFSESSGDELSCSYSPSRSKGILKRLDRRNISRSISESSIDDYVYASSLDNYHDTTIPEEDTEVSTSLKKTVRFSERVSKQLYRSNSSILGQKKKNQKKAKAKKRAHERRCSESEASEGEEKRDGDCKNQSEDEKDLGDEKDDETNVFDLDMYF